MLFSGIIRRVGYIKYLSGIQFDVSACMWIWCSCFNVTEGASFSVDGICLTVVDKVETFKYCLLKFNIGASTFERTNLSFQEVGKVVNLEQAISLQDGLNGHIVQGHVDAVIILKKIYVDSCNSRTMFFSMPKKFGYCILPSASVAINGVSLTVSDVDYSDKSFSVNVLNYTYHHTNLAFLSLDDKCNCEVDILIKSIHKR